MSNNKSFTLIELLVVIAIIGVLAAIIITSMSGAVTRSKITRLQVFSDTIRAQLSDSLVSYWSFNEGTGTTVYDKWEGNNGTLHGDPTWKSGGDCVSGSCLEFDGVDDYVNCGNDVSLKPIDGLTLEAWVYFKSNTARQTIIDDSSYDAYSLIVYHGSPGTLRFWLNYHGGDMDTTVPSLNEWHHVVATYDRTLASANMKIYIDAVFVKGRNSTTVLPQTASNVYIGYTTWGSGYSFDGLIDEVRIYNSAATISQIQSQYLAGLDKLLSNGAISKSEYNQRIKKLSKEIVIE